MMDKTKTAFGAALAVVLLAGAPSQTRACGFEDPTAVAIGALNFFYPDSLHVTGAIWAGQQAGDLAMPDRARLQARGEDRKRLDTLAFHRATRILRGLGAAFDEAGSDPEVPEMALVLVETALWTRYAAVGGSVATTVHAKGPDDGDLVVVTGEALLHGLGKSRLSLAQAAERGYLRLYGTPEQEKAFLAAYGDIGLQPLPLARQSLWAQRDLLEPPAQSSLSRRGEER